MKPLLVLFHNNEPEIDEANVAIFHYIVGGGPAGLIFNFIMDGLAFIKA